MASQASLPIVDDQAAAAAAVEPPAAPPAPPVADPTAPPAASAAPTTDPATPAADPNSPPPAPWEGKTPQELWELNEKLKKENVGYKDRFRPYEELFADLHPDDGAAIRDFVSGMKAGKIDPALAADFRQALDRLTPAQQEAALDAAEQAKAAGEPLKPEAVAELVAKQVEERLTARDEAAKAERAQADALAEIAKHLKAQGDALGLPELGDPTSDEYALVLSRAKALAGEIPDPMARLTAAATAVVGNLNARAQALLKSKIPGADAPPAVPSGGNDPGTEKPMTTDLKGAHRGAAERLDKILAGNVGE